jgi:hypothetical protein
MAKDFDTKKEDKKKPQKTLMEKRLEKKMKKAGQAFPSYQSTPPTQA